MFHGGLFLFAPAALAPLAPQLNGLFRDTLVLPDISQRYREASIDPLPLDVAGTAALVRQRLQVVDAMRLATFGRAR